MIENEPTPVPQSGEVVKFKRRMPNESELQYSMSFDQMYDAIRMVDAPGYPNAYIPFGSIRLRLTNARWIDGKLEARVIFEAEDNES